MTTSTDFELVHLKPAYLDTAHYLAGFSAGEERLWMHVFCSQVYRRPSGVYVSLERGILDPSGSPRTRSEFVRRIHVLTTRGKAPRKTRDVAEWLDPHVPDILLAYYRDPDSAEPLIERIRHSHLVEQD